MNRQHINVRKMRTQGWTRGAYGQGIVYGDKRGRNANQINALRVAHCAKSYDHAVGDIVIHGKVKPQRAKPAWIVAE